MCPTDGTVLVREVAEAPAERDPMIGRTLEGRYTITARLGSGSMGTVYRATQHAMGREVAIKILRGDRAVDDSAKARFMREARANSLLASPNTVTVFDFGESESGEFYLAMELLEGESVGQRLTRMGRLPIPMAVDAARQALRSLAEAHAKRIIHRDLKPDNLFFARVVTSALPAASGASAHDEIVKVLDFGIAKMLRDSDSPMGVIETQAGTVFGTPRYMSPEQAQGKLLDPRTDLYSLGVILYQMLTGRPPFTDNDAVVVMARHIKSVPKRMSEVCPDANIPKELEAVVMRALSKDPAERHASAEIFAGELLAALEAQGATTSGVRASITNAAGIRVPESMRPPPVSLPPTARTRQRRTAFGLPLTVVALAAPIIILVTAAGVYLGMRSGSQNAPAPTTSASSAPPPPQPTASASAPPVRTKELPTLTPDSLPTAEKATAAPTTAPPPAAKQPMARPAGRPATKPPTPATRPRAGASTAPSSTSNYGVFE